MATLREMTDRVLDATGRPPNSHRGEAQKLVNDAYIDTVRRARLDQKQATLSLTPNTATYSFKNDLAINDLVAIRALTYTLSGDNTAFPLQEISLDDLLWLREGAQTASGETQAYAFWGADNLGLWPGPSTPDTLVLFYDSRPDLMTLDDDEPDALPAEFHYVIEDGAIARSARYKPALGQVARDAQARYTQGVNDLRAYRNHRGGAQPESVPVGRKRHLMRRGPGSNSIYFTGDS